MTRTRSFWTGFLAAALASAFGCASEPVRIAAPSGPLNFSQGRPVSGSACGFQLLYFIPIEVNSRASRAYSELQSFAGRDVLTDVRVTERWFYGLVGTGYCTEMTGTAYPRG
jgi:hypothetical protein